MVAALGKPLETRIRNVILDGMLPRVVNFMRDAVTESFRTAFAETLVPASEKALGAVLSQVGTTFDRGVASILEQVLPLLPRRNGGGGVSHFSPDRGRKCCLIVSGW